ncbi:g4952 [Coccomyxa viridis]|uniref:G4952 protein n=1 Tax=Coccomyxa viridis TaxID=1274662 RepID=A0ABP1FWJ8_9CHLO
MSIFKEFFTPKQEREPGPPLSVVLHPFYPQSLLLPGYEPLTIPFDQILGIFFGVTAIVFIVVWLASGRVSHFGIGDRLTVTWLVITGIIHMLVEGAVVLNADFYKSTSKNILFEIWKEYGKADSRYLTRDSFVINMEAFTAFVVGPMCFWAVAGMVHQKPWRHLLALIVSVCQLYGDVLYFATTGSEGWIHSRPEPLYFWFYFVVINGIWVVIPGIIAVASSAKLCRAVAAQDRISWPANHAKTA